MDNKQTITDIIPDIDKVKEISNNKLKNHLKEKAEEVAFKVLKAANEGKTLCFVSDLPEAIIQFLRSKGYKVGYCPGSEVNMIISWTERIKS